MRLVTDTDAHLMDYMARRTSNDGTKSAPIVIEDDVWVLTVSSSKVSRLVQEVSSVLVA